MDKEIRYFENPVVIEEREGEDSRHISGYAAVFNKLSQDLGWFREKIDPAAFEKCDMADVIACRNHDPDKVMARTTAKTLDLNIDAKGLKYGFDAPNTSAGNDTLEDIQLKNIVASSFAFTVASDMWEEGKTKNDPDIRTILEFKKLYDVSPVTNPAYLQTSVGANSLDLAKRSYDEWKDTIKNESKEEEIPPETLSVREAEQQLIEISLNRA